MRRASQEPSRFRVPGFTGWTENPAIRNSAHKWIIAAMETVASRLPFMLTGLDTGNGGEFINNAWPAGPPTEYLLHPRPGPQVQQ